MQYEKSCGAVVYRRHHGNIEVLLVRNIVGGHWSFPKGHVENDETEHQTAKREILEETGIDVSIVDNFREVVTYYPKKNTTKDVVFFLAKALNFNYTPLEEEIKQIKWVEINHALSIVSYSSNRRLIDLAKKMIISLPV